jgi:hypothetical protein
MRCIKQWQSKSGNTWMQFVFARFFSRPVSMFILNSLQFLSRGIQICSGCIAPTCTSIAKGCTSQKTLIFIVTFWRTSNLTSKALSPSPAPHLSTTFCSNKRLASFRMNETENYRIPRPIRRTFFPKKCDLNSICVLCAEGKYYFPTYKYLYIYYTTSLSWNSENNHEDDFSGSDDDFLGFYDE